MKDIEKRSLELHEKIAGKIETTAKVEVKNKEDLSLVYSPGVAAPCAEIEKNKEDAYKYTMKGSTVAIVTDGTAVLGMGDIGPDAAMPVMEGKSLLLKDFAGVNAFPIGLRTKEVDEIVNIVKNISTGFGAILLEDISSPRCMEIENILENELDIPVFHDDQHGTAIVTLAGLVNACRVLKRDIKEQKIVMNGAGAAGVAIAKILIDYGVKDIVVCDSKGIIYQGREGLNKEKQVIAELTAQSSTKAGTIEDAVKDRDVFIGVSVGNTLTENHVKSMSKDPIIFALANPQPEIDPSKAKNAGAKVIATGRSDYPNQINNVLAFPGIFKGALEAKATHINKEMKIAAVDAIVQSVDEKDLSEDFIVPDPFNRKVVENVSKAVAKAAIESKCVRS